jgi:hypothetical protein
MTDKDLDRNLGAALNAMLGDTDDMHRMELALVVAAAGGRVVVHRDMVINKAYRLTSEVDRNRDCMVYTAEALPVAEAMAEAVTCSVINKAKQHGN